MSRRALGRGLDALLPVSAEKAPTGFGDGSVFMCPIEKIVPQKDQPRQYFEDRSLDELAQSILEVGLLEPLVVRKKTSNETHTLTDKYELIAGERRWRAAQRAGLHEVLVVVKDVSSSDAFELAIIENVQREDLNPIELSEAFSRLIKDHGYTQERLAERIGKDRSTITNSLRLLKLPETVREKVIVGELSEGHARALLAVPDEEQLVRLANKVIHGRLSVRQTEQLARNAKASSIPPKASADTDTMAPPDNPNLKDLERKLSLTLGSRCVVRDREGIGEIIISYADAEQREYLIERLLAL